MGTFISMLRGINVSGQKKVRMEDLRNAYKALGLSHVETYVQSGNVVFDSLEEDAMKLTGLLEAQIEKSFGFNTPVFIRRAGEFQSIIHSNPFLSGRSEDPAKLHVTFLYATPTKNNLEDVTNPNSDGDEFSLLGNEIYLFCPNGYGRTKLNNNFFERKLNQPTTTRNWKTVNALYEMAIG